MKAMKKTAYEKPAMTTVLLQHKSNLLQASQTPPNEIPNYDDWFGAKEETYDVDVWDEEW